MTRSGYLILVDGFTVDERRLVRDGKIARFQQYADTWQIAQVTGVTPKS